MEFDDLSHQVIGCAIEVHRELGPGLLESAYEEGLAYELEQEGLSFARQVELPIAYKGKQLSGSYRMDIVVDNHLVLELKSVEQLLGIHEAQLLTYMKLSRIPTGILLNFNSSRLKDGLKRFVL